MQAAAARFSRVWFRWLSCGLCAGWLAGCGGNDSTADVATKKKTAVKTEAAAPAEAAAQPLRVNVFLEYSGGMKGFMPAGNAQTPPTEFQRRVGSLLTETQVNGAVAERKFFLLDRDGAPAAQPYAKLLETVEGLNPNAALGTELPQMLEGVLARPGAEREVNVVVSDFIYGPKVKADFALLPDLVRSAIAPVQRRQLAVAVLGERSSFYGTYHPAVKTPVAKRQLRGEKVPYYVWVIGPPAQVSRYVSQVLKSLPAEQAYFGLTVPTPAYAALLTKLAEPQLKPSGTGTVFFNADADNPAAGHDLAADVRDGAVEFTVGLNLAGLPPAWQQPAYLREHLQAQLPQGQASLGAAPTVYQLSEAQQTNSPALAPYTHAVRLRLSKLPTGTSPLTLTLPAPETPAWVAAWSTQNDNQPSGRTFGLSQVLQGVRDSYPAALPPVFAVRFTVKKDG